MERKTLAITAPAMAFRLRGAFGSYKVFGFLLLLSCLLLPFTSTAEYDSCGSPGYNPVVGFQDFTAGDVSSGYAEESSGARQSVCTALHSFCFLSSLGFGNQSDPLFSLEESNPSKSWNDRNWSSDYDMFELTNGRKVSCSLNSQDEIPIPSSVQAVSANQNSLSAYKNDADVRLIDNLGMTKPDSSSDGPSCFRVEINPPVLDWGEKFLFFPSVAFLTVENKCNDSILHVYESFSTDKQFYPCNNTGFLLSPGEVASVCFMFLPQWLGLSSAHLVMQTNRGGFLVQAKGFAVKSVYGAHSLVSIDISSNPWSMKNFVVFNPLDEPLYVKGVKAWISISSGKASVETEVNCLVENQDSREIPLLRVTNQLIQMVALKPHGNWEIGPGKREGILEMEWLPNLEGRISGTIYLQLLRSSKEQIDTIAFPLDIDMGKQQNDSSNPEVEILCHDIFHICSRNKKVGSLGSGMPSSSSSSSQIKVGTHGSMCITVKNPNQEPVVMHLILNTGEIIDECKAEEDDFHPYPSNGSDKNKAGNLRKHGFSLAENAVTEAYVFGPIYFHPSKHCWWRSCALKRNSLSGVELMISLKGHGGSLSLILLETSEPEDLPLEIQSISLSGTRCGGNGFVLTYHMDHHSSSTVRKDLEFALTSGVILAAVSLFWLVYFVIPQMTAINSNSKRVDESSSDSQEKQRFTISPEMDSLLRSMRDEKLKTLNNGKDGIYYSENNNSSVDTQSRTPLASSVLVQETSQPMNLRVKTVRDKKKRRRKKKKAVITLTASTPSSPMSPVRSASPVLFRPIDPSPVSSEPEINVERSRSSLGLHAKAPGVKLGGKERWRGEGEEEGKRKEERYDIWGRDHLSGLNLMERLKEVRSGQSLGFADDDDDSHSFFVKGPHCFLPNPHPRYINQRG